MTERKIAIELASLEDYETVQNLGRFYVYDMSRYCGDMQGWEVPENGLFECIDLKKYFVEATRRAFIVRVNNELAGFALLSKVGATVDVDWKLGEFFIVAKFQGRGVGKYVAHYLFKSFPGIWEIAAMVKNTAARNSWAKIIADFTGGQFDEAGKVVDDPKIYTYPMILFKFRSL